MRLERWLAVIGLGLAALSAQAPARAAVAQDASAECVECHDDEELADSGRGPHARGARKPPMAAAAEAMNRRSMADAADTRTPTCITCHGPSLSHARKVAGKKQGPPDRIFAGSGALPAHERTAVCQDCHDKDASRTWWEGSQHQSADIACNNCHRVHTNKDKSLARGTQTEVCYACHKAQRAQMSRPSHHPVPEGKMGCSDCHNVHGSSGPKLARRDSTNDTCYTCHAEKRGPFVHSHQPVAEDCSNCHSAHGSTVQALLKARPPMLCQQCHTPHVAGAVGAVGGQPGVFAPAVPGQTGPQVGAVSSGKNVVNLWQGRSCTNCHTQVHGSNNPSATNPTPQFMLR